jgi:hypothetical protein
MSRIRLALTENRLSDPARITREMYEEYLGKNPAVAGSRKTGARADLGCFRVFDHQLHLGDAVVFVGVEPEGDAGALT